VARAARIEGTVRLRVSTDGEKVVDVTVEQGQPLLAKAAQDNVRTWQFAKHSPTVFETTFAFHLLTDCEQVYENGRITLTLPAEVEVTATPTVEECNPEAVLDLSEPLRVFLTACEVDGAVVPCDEFTVKLTSESKTEVPERFKDKAGSEGFVVPASFRKLEYFGVVIQTPKGTFSVFHIHGSFLKGRWRVVIDHAPFQEEWRYLTNKKQRCVGLIHFQWSEPERLVTATCQ
jgi:hypothetical protein